jgi:hypothetical protein
MPRLSAARARTAKSASTARSFTTRIPRTPCSTRLKRCAGRARPAICSAGRSTRAGVGCCRSSNAGSKSTESTACCARRAAPKRPLPAPSRNSGCLAPAWTSRPCWRRSRISPAVKACPLGRTTAIGLMCDASATLSRLGMEGSARYVEMAARCTTTLNAFPEAIRPDGVYVKTWYPTVHDDFVHAVNLLLLRRRSDVVELFPGVPADWGDASFDSLRAPVGLVVSASRTAKGIVARVLNDGDRRQQFKVRACNAPAWEEAVVLEPGQSVSLPR